MNKRIYTALSIVCFTFLMVMSGCDVNKVSDAADDFRLIIGLDPINTTPTVLITDAESGELLSSNVDVTFLGQNGSNVIDIYSEPLISDQVSGGILNFGIQNSITPSDERPVRIQLLLQSDGYIQTSKTIQIKEEGSPDFSIKMLKEGSNQLPDGIKKTTNREGSAESDGNIKQSFTVESFINQNEGGTSLEVSSGSTFLSETGEALTGQLTTELTYYASSESESLQLTPFELTDDDGNNIQVSGVNTIQIYDGNENVATSVELSSDQQKALTAEEGELSISFTIPEGYKTISGGSYEVGEEISVFLYDSNLQLSETLDEVVETLASGKYGVVFNTTIVPRAVAIGTLITETNSCPAQITIERNGNEGTLKGRVYSDGFFTEINIPSDENTFEFLAPNNTLNIEVDASASSYSSQVNFCNQPDEVIELASPPADIIDASVEVSLSCVDNSDVISITDLPGASIAYRKTAASGGTQWRLAENVTWNYDDEADALTGGNFDILGVEQGFNYDLKLSFNGDTYQKDLLVDGPMIEYEEVIDEEVCQ